MAYCMVDQWARIVNPSVAHGQAVKTNERPMGDLWSSTMNSWMTHEPSRSFTVDPWSTHCRPMVDP